MSIFWAKPWEYFRGFVAAIAEPSALMSCAFVVAWMGNCGYMFFFRSFAAAVAGLPE